MCWSRGQLVTEVVSFCWPSLNWNTQRSLLSCCQFWPQWKNRSRCSSSKGHNSCMITFYTIQKMIKKSPPFFFFCCERWMYEWVMYFFFFFVSWMCWCLLPKTSADKGEILYVTWQKNIYISIKFLLFLLMSIILSILFFFFSRSAFAIAQKKKKVAFIFYSWNEIHLY